MFPSFNYSTFVKSFNINSAINESLHLAKAIVKETCSQAISLIPSAIVAISGSSTLQSCSNIVSGSLSITKGLTGYHGLTQSNKAASKMSKFLAVAESTKDIGVGCLFLAYGLGNTELRMLLHFYHSVSANVHLLKALGRGGNLLFRPSLSKRQYRKEVAKVFVDCCSGVLKLNALRKYGKEFIFTRNKFKDSDVQRPLISERTFNIIQSKSPEGVIFNQTSLYPFDHRGTCSAMALDFISQYNTKCKDVSEKVACVAGLKDYFQANTEIFSSVQAAFNTIEIVESRTKIHDLNSENNFLGVNDLISHKKMQALANYHDLSLTPVTKTLDTENTDDIKDVVKNLPYGSYILRMLKPSSKTRKLEVYGHTMGFIKDEKQSLFYDNHKGVLKLIDVSNDFLKSVGHWSFIPTIRIYQAECPPKGCQNLNSLQIN